MGRQKKYLENVCNLPIPLRHLTFADLALSGENWPAGISEGRTEAYEAAKQIFTAHGWLALIGDYGSGKTRIGAMMVNRWIEDGREARYFLMADLLDHLRKAFDPKTGQGYSNLFDDLCACPLLVLDECDQFNPTPWARERFRLLAEKRYEERTRQSTVWLTNTDPDTWGMDADFLRSRLKDAVVVRMIGDFRGQ